MKYSLSKINATKKTCLLLTIKACVIVFLQFRPFLKFYRRIQTMPDFDNNTWLCFKVLRKEIIGYTSAYNCTEIVQKFWTNIKCLYAIWISRTTLYRAIFLRSFSILEQSVINKMTYSSKYQGERRKVKIFNRLRKCYLTVSRTLGVNFNWLNTNYRILQTHIVTLKSMTSPKFAGQLKYVVCVNKIFVN